MLSSGLSSASAGELVWLSSRRWKGKAERRGTAGGHSRHPWVTRRARVERKGGELRGQAVVKLSMGEQGMCEG